MVAITRKLNRFDKAASKAKTVEAMKAAWKRTMKMTLSDKSADIFVRHYKKMPKRRGQRGGAAYTSEPASLDYVMGPGQAGSVQAAGFPVSAAFGPVQYGHFTDDVTANPTLLRNVGGPAEIPEIAQNKDCGVDRYPTNTHLAQVGAGYMRKNRTKTRMMRSRRRNNRRTNRRNTRTNRRNKQRGGNLLTALMNPLNPLGSNSVYSPPTLPVGDHSWTNQNSGTLINLAGVNQLQASSPMATLQTWGSGGLGYVNAANTGQTFSTAAAAAATSATS